MPRPSYVSTPSNTTSRNRRTLAELTEKRWTQQLFLMSYCLPLLHMDFFIAAKQWEKRSPHLTDSSKLCFREFGRRINSGWIGFLRKLRRPVIISKYHMTFLNCIIIRSISSIMNIWFSHPFFLTILSTFFNFLRLRRTIQ